MKRAIASVAAFALLALSGCDDMALRDSIVDLVTRASNTVPEAPSGLGASALSSSSIRLTWTDNSGNEAGFKIERSPDGSSGWTQVQLTAAGATTWDDSGLSPGTTYYYRVRATNSAGDSAYSNVANATTLQTAPAAPSGLTATALSISSIRVAWSDNSSNETGFKIERSPNGTSGWTQVFLTGADATSWDDWGLSEGTTYYYRVRASNAAGDSPYSNAASDTTYLPSFSGGVAIKAAGDSIAMGDGLYGPNPTVAQTISYNFTMSKYEITNSQFAQFIADGGYTTQSYWTTNGWNYKQSQGWTQPAYWTDANFNGANQPVVGVSWYEAVAYCNWRSQKEFSTPAYDSTGHATLSASGYRLPTEVEWEYAAAKGASGQAERIYAWGDIWDSNKAVCSVLPASATKTADVGSKSTAGDTPQGLADMSGNVWEWCSDNYQSDASVASVPNRYYFLDDSTSQYLMFRGGAWYDTNEGFFRCAYREHFNPDDCSNGFGFRVVRP